MTKPGLLFIFLVLLTTSTPVVCGDGMGIRMREEIQTTSYVIESRQDCVIIPKLLRQEMLLSVDFKEDFSNGVWIFPVPSRPELVKIDILNERPSFNGIHVKDNSRETLKSVDLMLKLSQIYTYPLMGFNFNRRGSYTMGLMLKEFDNMGSTTSSVTVYSTAKAYGLTTEVIGAGNIESLERYVALKGMELPPSSIPILNEYLGKGYCFIVSHASGEDQGRSVKISVDFPTKDLYFPLKLTSVYRDDWIKYSIVVIGHATPTRMTQHPEIHEIDYYSDGEFKFGNYTDLGVRITEIKASTLGKNLQNDLWMSRSAPLGIWLLEVFAVLPELSLFIALLIVSIISAGFTGIIVHRERFNFWESAKLGIANMTTLLGLCFALYMIEFYDEKGSRKWTTGVNYGFSLEKVAFALTFSFVFLLCSGYTIRFLNMLAM